MNRDLLKAFAFVLSFIVVLSACVSHEFPSPADCSSNPVELQEGSVVHSECGLQAGAFEVEALGGRPPYSYTLDSGTPQSSGEFLNLTAGNYGVTVTDARGCAATIAIEVRNLIGVNLDVTSSPSGCKSADGTISATGSNGVGPYSYKLGDGAFQPSGEFTGLASGSYTVVARDATNCEVAKTVSVASGISYQAHIAPIVSNSCAISGCHNGSQFPDFRSFANIKANAAQIKTLTSNGTMPQEGKLTQAQINAIACWVDDGAPEN